MKYPFIQQEDDNDCGLACVAMLYRFYFRKKILINQIKQDVILTPQGINIGQLKTIAQKYNLLLESYYLNFNELKTLIISTPLIIQIYNPNIGFHFIIIYKKKNEKWLIADPEDMEVTWKKFDQLSPIFSNVVISTKPLNNFSSHNNVKINKPKNHGFSPFIVPSYLSYAIICIINNLFLVTTFFIAQIFYKNLINQIMINNNWQLAVMLLLCFFFINLFKILMEYILNKLYQTFLFYFNNVLIQKFHHQWFSRTPLQMQKYGSSEFLQIYEDITNISTMFCSNILELIINFITCIIVSIVLIKIHLLMWLVNLLNGMITLLINFIVMLWKKPLVKLQIMTKMQFYQQIILSQKTFEESYFRSFQPYIKTTLNQKYNNYINNDWKLNSWTNNNNSLISIIKNIVNFITIYLSLILIFDNKINLSQLIFITTINVYFLNFFQNLGDTIIFFPLLSKSQQRFNNFMNVKSSFEHTNFSLNAVNIVINKITIKNCTFKFANKVIFSNLTLTLQQNNMIIGATGVGKTTLLLLIAQKFHDFQGHIILNDNIKLQQFSLKQWQKMCVYLVSNPTIFRGTILENILSFNINQEKLVEFQKIGGDKILAMLNLTPFYYCQEYGVNLSQGQKQIIVFLSLFFTNWKVILLDEILSNVNNDLKKYLIKMLLTHFKKTIIIYAGHDLELLGLFENIINLTSIIKSDGKNNDLKK